MNRILPISSIRFVLASWVVLSHYGMPILTDHRELDLLGFVRAGVGAAFNGPAAVIVFFVISGFCIHFPNRNGLEVQSWKLYYAKRYVRTLIPMAAALALAFPLKVPFGLFTDSVLWSLLCEEIYYFVYPGLLYLRDRLGWTSLQILAWGMSFLVILRAPGSPIYPAYGPGLNWVLGLPCWLLGCRMAERLVAFQDQPFSRRRIWLWRTTIWVLSVMSLVLRFHLGIGYPWTLNLFAAFSTLWLEREIRYYRSRPAPRLERMGEASYSLYLTHFSSAAIVRVLPNYSLLAPISVWLWSLASCATVAALFYRFIELPSHEFARHLKRWKPRLRQLNNTRLHRIPSDLASQLPDRTQ